MFELTIAEELLKQEEGLSLKPYKCTGGKISIGFGRNLQDKGLTEKECEFLLHNDLLELHETLPKKIEFWDNLSDIRKAILIDMAYNLGINGLLNFKEMLSALESKDYKKASQEMLNSKWSKQVKSRSAKLSMLMIENKI